MKRRWIILMASLVFQVILGGIYAWSIFIPSLQRLYDISTSKSSFIFGLTIFVFTLTMIFAGKVLNKIGPRFTAIIGATFYAAGFLLASFSGGNYYIILIGIGIITGIGIGFGYICPLTTCIKWFPKQKGLITGLAVAGFGGGAILLTRHVSFLLNMGLDTLDIFQNIAVVAGIPALIAASLLTNPPDYRVAKEKAAQNIMTLLKNRVTLAAIIGIFSGTFGGLMVVSNIKVIGLTSQLAENYAILSISLFAIGNALGRIIWGTVFDRVGRIAIPVSLTLLGLSSLLLLLSSPVLFNLGALITGIAFGGCFVLYFLRIEDRFGDLVAQIYPYIFLFYGMSAIFGPMLGGWIFDQTGTYILAIIVMLLLNLSGGFLVVRIDQQN